MAAIMALEVTAGYLNGHMKFPHGHVALGVAGGDVLEKPGHYLKDRDLFWRLMPGRNGNNSLGLRDREFTVQKTNDILRIICLGDSLTLAYPIPPEKTYPKILEKILSARSLGKKVEVMNAGVPGYTSHQGLIFLQKALIKYHPDLLIVYFGTSDQSGSNKFDKDQPKLPAWWICLINHLQKLQLYQLLNKISLNLQYPRDAGTRYRCPRVSPKDFTNNLSRMERIVKEIGGAVVFITPPAVYDRERKRVFTYEAYRLPSGHLQFDAFEQFKQDGAHPENLFADEKQQDVAHLSEKGCEFLAEGLAEFLIEKDIIRGFKK